MKKRTNFKLAVCLIAVALTMSLSACSGEEQSSSQEQTNLLEQSSSQIEESSAVVEETSSSQIEESSEVVEESSSQIEESSEVTEQSSSSKESSNVEENNDETSSSEEIVSSSSKEIKEEQIQQTQNKNKGYKIGDKITVNGEEYTVLFINDYGDIEYKREKLPENPDKPLYWKNISYFVEPNGELFQHISYEERHDEEAEYYRNNDPDYLAALEWVRTHLSVG